MRKVEKYASQNKLFNISDRVVLAVSGGPDSLCLFHLFLKLMEQYDLKLVVAHLNHCLRPEGPGEAEAVAKLAGEHGLPCEIRAVDIGALKNELGIGEEEAGRLARYQLFLEVANKYNATTLATGHHRDDLAETVLLNIIRGSSVDGLAGILPKRRWKGLKLIRPLLCLRRSEIEEFCNLNNLKPFTDSSNLERNYKRNKLRLDLIPYLEKQYNPRIIEALANLGDLAAQDRRLLQALARLYYKRYAHFDGPFTRLDRTAVIDLPPALKGRVIFKALAKHIAPGQLNRLHIRRLEGFLANSKEGSRLSLPGGMEAKLSGPFLILSPVKQKGPEKRLDPVILPVPGHIMLSPSSCIEAKMISRQEMSWPPGKNQAYLDFEKLPPAPLLVRSRRPGDRFHPQGAKGSKKLKDFLIDQKVPLARRQKLPLVTVGEEIIWLAGLRIAHPYRITEQTKQVLTLEYKNKPK